MTLDITIIVALISLFGTVLLGILQYKKTKSEATKTTVEGVNILEDAAIKLVKTYTEENQKLREKLEELIVLKDLLEQKVDSLTNHIINLEEQINFLEARVGELTESLDEHKKLLKEK